MSGPSKHREHRGTCDHGPKPSSRSLLHGRWLLGSATVASIVALCWLVLRSGARPDRLRYPCQQAALSSAWAAFAVPVWAAVTQVRRGLITGPRRWRVLVMALICLTTSLGGGLVYSRTRTGDRTLLAPPTAYRAQLYHVTNCPQAPVGDRFPGLDNLLTLMGSRGLKLHRSPTLAATSGPQGIVGATDTVVVKINYQWSARGGTNTELLRGLIARILDHPDGFAGEVVICENTQFASSNAFDRTLNNAEDRALSPADIVQHFQDQGHAVSLYDWRPLRSLHVEEYAGGDDRDGYVVYPYDSRIRGRVSYPKFLTSYGTRISLKDGLWDPGSGSYDRQQLKLINLPVLKSHSAEYGVTASVKHYMGVVTDSLSTNSHNAIRNGLMGALLAEIGLADLNILDCIWINANPYTGPATSYSGATRRDELVAATDPVALDLWAASNILVPAFIANGYTPPWPYPTADPADPGSDFRTYLDNSMDRLLAAGIDVTNDLASMDVHSWDGTGLLRPTPRRRLRPAVVSEASFSPEDRRSWPGPQPPQGARFPGR